MKFPSRRWLMLPVVLCALWCPAARAQGCPMCKAVLAGSPEGQKAAQKINAGIIVLLIPPVAMMCSIFGLAYRKRNLFGLDQTSSPSRASLAAGNNMTAPMDPRIHRSRLPAIRKAVTEPVETGVHLSGESP